MLECLNVIIDVLHLFIYSIYHVRYRGRVRTIVRFTYRSTDAISENHHINL